jgi:multidrug resistance efflux pump
MQLDIERNTQSYQQTRLEYLKERVDLDIERVNAKYYASEVARQQQLINNTPPLVDVTTYEYWVRLASTSRTNVLEREKYLAEKEQTLPKLAPSNQADDAILEAIKAQEDQLRATEQPISLKSPMDGMVSMVLHLQGEKIVANLPIVTISATSATRIVGYVRKPFSLIPRAGDTVQIRRQTFKREVADAKVVEVSNQLEPIATTLIPAPTGAKTEMGLPFAVSIPSEIALIPGEAVDLIFKRR